ncbi:MAG TPA: hypothetical protein PKW80_09100 [Bacteroidales bacterium]|nr:hypothetical protein [Bacteroidales bacterium]
MKICRSIRIFLIPVILFFTAGISAVSAQYSEEELITTGYRSDGIINILIDYLPAGWTFHESNGFFIIQRTDSIWVLSENTLNVPFEKQKERNERIIKNGKRAVSKIVIRYEDKWDFLKFQEASLTNSAVQNEIIQLPEKIGIKELRDSKLSTKGHTVYTPQSEADEQKISKYYVERKKLEDKIIRTPDNNTQKYSLFVVSKIGCNDDAHIVSPDEASVELYSIISFINEISGK